MADLSGASSSPPPSGESAPVDVFVESACLTFQSDDGVTRRRPAERLARAEGGLADETIYAAAALADVAAVRRHLARDAGLAVRAGGPRGWVPLLYLAFSRVFAAPERRDAVGVARLLLAAGADPRSEVRFHERYRWTAITAAVGEGESGPIAAPPHPEARALVELLLDAGADPNDSQALYDVHFRRDNRWLELFLARGLGSEHLANWTEDSAIGILEYLLGQAVKQGFFDRVALLLAHGASPNGHNHYTKRTHLETAQLAGHTEIADWLLRQGATPVALTSAEALHVACLRGDQAVVRQALAQPQPIDGRDDVGTLLVAATYGRLSAVRLLLDLGVPVDASNADGLTALHMAASNGHRLVVDELLARGASLELRDRVYSGTPLGRVTWFSRVWPSAERDEVRRALAGHSTNVFDVTFAGAIDRLATLLAADPALARSRHPLDGRSPLHVLADRGVPEWRPLLALLLQHGADPDARNDAGKTPLDAAKAVEADDLVAALAAITRA